MFKNIVASAAVLALVDARSSIPACNSFQHAEGKCQKDSSADADVVPTVAPELGPGNVYSLNQAKLI